MTIDSGSMSPLASKVEADLRREVLPLEFKAGEDIATAGIISNIHVSPKYSAEGRLCCMVQVHSILPGRLDFSGLRWKLQSADEELVDSGVCDRWGCFYAGRELGLRAGERYRFSLSPDIGDDFIHVGFRSRPLGRTVQVMPVIVGGSTRSELRPVLPDGQLFGWSPDRRSLLVRCPERDLKGEGPFSIVVARCTTSDGRIFVRPVVITWNSSSAQYEGSITVDELMDGTRREFQDHDVLDVVTVPSPEEALAAGLTVEMLAATLNTDPIARNTPHARKLIVKLYDALKKITEPKDTDE